MKVKGVRLWWWVAVALSVAVLVSGTPGPVATSAGNAPCIQATSSERIASGLSGDRSDPQSMAVGYAVERGSH
jgi:hypothetical protein